VYGYPQKAAVIPYANVLIKIRLCKKNFIKLHAKKRWAAKAYLLTLRGIGVLAKGRKDATLHRLSKILNSSGS
jgi:hypothetical protein